MAHKCEGCRYKGEHREMMFGPMGVCTRELNLADAVKNYEAEKCPYKKTNADRIRAMSDEELAKWIDWLFGRCEWCDTDKMATDDCNDVECTYCILEWLKQPADMRGEEDG